MSHHYREPITYGEYLKLLWQVPLECAACHRKPPEVKLHIDHVVPVSRGGRSKRENLQFLCEADNLKKSNQREVTSSWLTLQ
jgi:5-methylcytosine-specific restriction endonuclease McrA